MTEFFVAEKIVNPHFKGVKQLWIFLRLVWTDNSIRLLDKREQAPRLTAEVKNCFIFTHKIWWWWKMYQT